MSATDTTWTDGRADTDARDPTNNQTGDPAGGFAIGGDRSTARRRAQRHSKLVSTLKLALPVAAVATVGVYAFSILQSTGWETSQTGITMPKIIPDKLTMANPYYEGFNADGSRYWIRAKTAEPNLKDLSKINLNEITGELTGTDGAVTTLTSESGVYYSRDNRVDLIGKTNIAGADGMKIATTLVTIDAKRGTIHVRRPVEVQAEAGTIRSDEAMIRFRSKEYTFTDNVRTRLRPPEKKTTSANKADDGSAQNTAEPAKDTATGGLFGTADGPIEVAANRLDVNDINKTALFSGGVTATQQGTTLQSSDMMAEYEGSAVPTEPKSEKSKAANGENDEAKSNGNLKRIRIANPLTITRPTGEVIRADRGDFDAIQNVGRLEGAFSLKQAPDTTVTADNAELNQQSSEIVLKGGVNLLQGDNILRGETLTYDTVNARMSLDGAGSAGNRIRAFFKQNRPAGDGAQKARTKPAEGIPFGGSFKTTPGEPVRIEAATLDVDDKTRRATFKGDVRVNQGNFVLQSNELVSRYTGSAALAPQAETTNSQQAKASKKPPPQLTVVNARGAVKIVSEDGQTATGDWADIFMKTNTAVVGGNVVLTQGNNVVRGTRLEIDMNTGLSALKSEPAGGNSGGSASPAGGWASTIDGGGAAKSRPSAVFYPSELKSRGSKPKTGAKSSDSGWSTRSGP